MDPLGSNLTCQASWQHHMVIQESCMPCTVGLWHSCPHLLLRQLLFQLLVALVVLLKLLLQSGTQGWSAQAVRSRFRGTLLHGAPQSVQCALDGSNGTGTAATKPAPTVQPASVSCSGSLPLLSQDMMLG